MTQLLQNAAYGTALILAVAVLRRALKDRLIPEARLALWAVCLFRLLTPKPPESVLSLWGLFARPSSAPSQTPQLYIPTVSAPVSQPAPAPQPSFPWETVLLAGWLIVGAVLAARYVLSWTRTRRAVACAVPLGRDDPRYLPLPKFARLREGPMEGAPLTFGVARPTVVLSPGLEGEELLCVLAHEGVHAQRRDNLWHYVMALALAVHWWNPAVWLMSRFLRQDVELSCDRAAVKRLGPDKRAEYARALVSLSTQADGPAFCQSFGRKATEERIRSIMKFKKTSVIGVILTLLLVVAVSVAFASEPKDPAGTVEFHGQTFDRADLSQETLDWLDWYLALPEEEQLAVSFVPPELIDGQGGEAEVRLYTQAPDGTWVRTDDTVNVPFDPSEVHVPTYVEEETDPDSEATGIIGERFYDYQITSGGETVSGGLTDPNVEGADPGMADIYRENGYAVDSAGCALVYDENGAVFMRTRTGYLPCIKDDCSISEEHYHEHGEVVCTSGVGLWRTWENMRLGNIYPVCTVDGCTLTGRHDHNGVTYCGGAGHHGSTCDGTCIHYAQQAAANGSTSTSGSTNTTGTTGTTNTTSHHSESHSSGHHGNGHH